METIRSADGTALAFDRLGAGDPVVLVSGASCARGIHEQLAGLLSADFTVFNYDRRGRGDSGDTAPYAVEREIEDLSAVIAEAGGSAVVFGNSSGGVLALRAAVAGLPITRVAVWEPPIMTDPDAPRRHRAYVAELAGLLAADRPGDAMALFMRIVGLPGEVIDGMRHAPMWPAMERIAPTLAYDAAVLGDSTTAALGGELTVPALVLDGSETGAWTRQMVQALGPVRHHTLQGQNHNVDFALLAPVVRDFFAS
ncbi:MAG: alpha/beta hydrolase [Streptosporangiaceae bacterium]